MNSEIVTYTGKVFDPLNPDPELICIEDIAHALSLQNRYNGHTRCAYSVAQHSVLVSDHLEAEHALWGLLHDAPEAYIGDLARPLKQMGGFGSAFRKVETVLMLAICDRFSLPLSMPYEVVRMDDVLLRSEIRDLMPDSAKWKEEFYLGETTWKIHPWSAQDAEDIFLDIFKELYA